MDKTDIRFVIAAPTFDTARFLPDLAAIEALGDRGKDLLAEFRDAAVDLINAGSLADFVARPTEIAGEYALEAVPSAAYLALLATFTARQHELSGGGHV